MTRSARCAKAIRSPPNSASALASHRLAAEVRDHEGNEIGYIARGRAPLAHGLLGTGAIFALLAQRRIGPTGRDDPVDYAEILDVDRAWPNGGSERSQKPWPAPSPSCMEGSTSVAFSIERSASHRAITWPRPAI